MSRQSLSNICTALAANFRNIRLFLILTSWRSNVAQGETGSWVYVGIPDQLIFKNTTFLIHRAQIQR